MKGIQKFLLASGVSVIVIGLLYGAAPKAVLGGIVGLAVEDNELHIFRAIMGLYCGLGALLIAGAVKEKHINTALLLEAVFLGSLAAGRVVSFIVDGNFHWFALLATGLEIPLFIVCVALLKIQLKKPQNDHAVGA